MADKPTEIIKPNERAIEKFNAKNSAKAMLELYPESAALTDKERAFIVALTTVAQHDRKLAAKLAGYRDNPNNLSTQARLLFNKPLVGEIIRSVYAKRYNDPNWAERELASMAGASMDHIVDIGEDGGMRLNWRKAQESGSLAAIKEVDVREDGTIGKVKMYDRQKALETLLQLHGRLKSGEPYQGSVTLTVNIMPMVETGKFSSEVVVEATAIKELPNGRDEPNPEVAATGSGGQCTQPAC